MVTASSTAELKELDGSIAAADRVLAEAGDDANLDRQHRIADALLTKAESLREIFHLRAALVCADEVVARFGSSQDPVLQRRLVSAGRVRGVALLALGRTEQALAVALEVAERASQADPGENRWDLASALMVQCGALLRLKRPAEARLIAERLAEEFGADPWQGPRNANMVGVGWLMKAEAIAADGGHGEAERDLDELVASFSPLAEPSVRSLIVGATTLKAQVIGPDRVEEALALRQAMIDEFATATRPGLRQRVGGTAIAQAIALRKLERADEAIALLDQTLGRLTADRDPRVSPSVELRAAALKAVYLRVQGRNDEAEAACEACLSHYPSMPPPDVERELAQLVRVQAGVLETMGKPERGILALDRILGCPEIELDRPGILAGALMQKVLLLERAHRDGDVLETCHEIVGRFDREPPPEAPWVVLDALHRVPFALQRLGRKREAVHACDAIVRRIQNAPEIEPRKLVLDLLTYKSQLVLNRGRRRQALKALDEVLRRAGEPPAHELEPLAKRARDAHAAISTQRNDRRRLLIAMFAPFGLLTVLAVGIRRTLKAAAR